MIQRRDIVKCIILSLITCGIYGIYWFVVMTDDANRLSNDNGVSGGMAFLLNLVTCGIYGIYWAYQMGKKIYTYGTNNNMQISDNSIVYLVLNIFGLSIVTYCLIQNDLNTISNNVAK